MKRTLLLLLALALVLGLCVPAAAAGSDMDTAMERVLRGIRGWQAEVDVSDLNIYLEETQAAMQRFYKNPELFYYDRFTVWSSSSTRKVSKIELHYHSGYDQRHVEAFQAAAEEALSCVIPGMDDLQKLLVLHDYLALNTVYDLENLNAGTVPQVSYTAYGALVLGVAVCQGYTLAYQYLLEKCGISTAYASSDDMDHGWCLVKLGGSWYHVDVTWDDPTPDRLGRVTHSHFLLSDAAISDADHGHYNWDTAYACTDTRYDGDVFWDSETYPLLNTGIIFTDSDTLWLLKEWGDGAEQIIGLVRRSWSTGAETIVAQVSDYWPAWEKADYYWTDAYSSLCQWDNRLFFHDSRNIYVYDPADGEWLTLFSYDAHDGYLYGLSPRTDDLLVLVKQDPDEEGRVYKFTPERKYPENPFTDVHTWDYFYNAVLWAYAGGVTKGTSDTEFSPLSTCTRGQVVTFLWRAMGWPEPQSEVNPFADVPVSAYYQKAVLWAVEQGITNGTGTDPETGKALFSPDAACSYAHILTFLWRCVTGKTASGYGDWYSEPLDWATDLTLLTNTSLGSYSATVTDNCPRCDVVTFLSRAVG